MGQGVGSDKEGENSGVSAVAQWVTNPTSIHEDLGSIPGLTQWVKFLALLQAVVQVTDEAWIPHCCGCGIGRQLQLQFDFWPWELPDATDASLKKPKGKKKKKKEEEEEGENSVKQR